MSNTRKNLRLFLTDTATVAAYVGDRVCLSTTPQDLIMPYIYYRLSTRTYDECSVDASKIPMFESYDLELVSDDESILYRDGGLEDVVRDALQGHTGSFGDGRVNNVFVDDQDDSYVPRESSEEGRFVVAMQVDIENSIGNGVEL